MSDIRTAKALNSAGSINNLKEEDFLVVKYGTLQNFKVDVFVAADSPLHDGLEALKGDLIPARGAIASAKNLMELQVALQQIFQEKDGQKARHIRLVQTKELESVLFRYLYG